MDSSFGNVFLFLTDLAWKSRLTIPILVTTAFLVMDIRLQIEINIQSGQVNATDTDDPLDHDIDDDSDSYTDDMDNSEYTNDSNSSDDISRLDAFDDLGSEYDVNEQSDSSL